MRAPVDVVGEQRDVSLGIEQEQHAKAVPFVGRERLDGRRDGDRSDDRVAFDERALLVRTPTGTP